MAQEERKGQCLYQTVSEKAACLYVQQEGQCFFKNRARKTNDLRLILTKNEQLSNPIMMCVSSGMGVGPKLTSDISFSTCGKGR